MPRAPKRCGRQGCETRVVGRTYCTEHDTEQRNQSTWGRGSTRQSRALRQQVLLHYPTCYLHYDDICTHVATEDDHIIPLSQGGTDDPTNHAGACAPCHRRKSQHEATRARQRATNNR